MIEASEMIMFAARRDARLKSEQQEDFNTFVKLLIGFFNNFIY